MLALKSQRSEEVLSREPGKEELTGLRTQQHDFQSWPWVAAALLISSFLEGMEFYLQAREQSEQINIP